MLDLSLTYAGNYSSTKNYEKLSVFELEVLHWKRFRFVPRCVLRYGGHYSMARELTSLQRR